MSPSDFFHLTCTTKEEPKTEKKEEKKENKNKNFFFYKKGLPDHLFKLLFISHHCLQIQDNESALIYLNHIENLIPLSKYVSTQISMAYYNVRKFEESESIFDKVRKSDPYLVVCFYFFFTI